MKNQNKNFEDSKNPNYESGSLKFTSDYVSSAQLFNAVQNWIKQDSRVKKAIIRPGGNSQIALDFLYDLSGLKNINKDLAFHKTIRPMFTEALGGDYMVGWDYGSPSIVVLE